MSLKAESVLPILNATIAAFHRAADSLILVKTAIETASSEGRDLNQTEIDGIKAAMANAEAQWFKRLET